MSRELGMFPYSADGVLAPHTDGTLMSVPTGRENTIMEPTGGAYTPNKNSGRIVKGTIGNTDLVYATQIAYGVFAGDS